MWLRKVLLYLLVSMFLVFEMGVQVSPSVMASDLQAAFGVSALGLGLMSSVYFYTYTLMQIPAGLFFDNYKLNKVTFYSLSTCAAGTLLFAEAHSIWMAGLARMLMGFGSAFAFISVLVLARDLFSENKFSLLTGLTQMLAALGAMGGSYPLAALIYAVGWRDAMLSLAVFGFVLAFLILRFVDYPKPVNGPCDAPNISAVLQRISGLLKSSFTWGVAVYACMLWAPMSAFASLWGVGFLQQVYQLSHAQAAMMVMWMWVGIAVGSPLVGLWSEYLATRKYMLLACALLGFAAFSCALTGAAHSQALLCMLIFFAGFACAGQALSFAAIRDRQANNGNLGAAIGVNNMAVVISGAIFQPLVGYLLDLSQPHHYRMALSVVALAYLIGVVVSWYWIPETLFRSSASQRAQEA